METQELDTLPLSQDLCTYKHIDIMHTYLCAFIFMHCLHRKWRCAGSSIISCSVTPHTKLPRTLKNDQESTRALTEPCRKGPGPQNLLDVDHLQHCSISQSPSGEEQQGPGAQTIVPSSHAPRLVIQGSAWLQGRIFL